MSGDRDAPYWRVVVHPYLNWRGRIRYEWIVGWRTNKQIRCDFGLPADTYEYRGWNYWPQKRGVAKTHADAMNAGRVWVWRQNDKQNKATISRKKWEQENAEGIDL